MTPAFVHSTPRWHLAVRPRVRRVTASTNGPPRLLRVGASIDITYPDTGYRPLHAAPPRHPTDGRSAARAGADPTERDTGGRSHWRSRGRSERRIASGCSNTHRGQKSSSRHSSPDAERGHRRDRRQTREHRASDCRWRNRMPERCDLGVCSRPSRFAGSSASGDECRESSFVRGGVFPSSRINPTL